MDGGKMSLALSTTIALLALIAFVLLRTDYDRLLQRFAFAKRRDRHVENWQFLLVIVPLLAGEIALFELTGQSWRSYWTVVAFTLYIPLNFMFMCNIFLAGAHREAAWICGVIITCLSSLLVFGELRLEWVLLGCVVVLPATLASGSRLRIPADVPLEHWLDRALSLNCQTVERRSSLPMWLATESRPRC